MPLIQHAEVTRMQTKSILSVSSSSRPNMEHRSLSSLIKPNPDFGIGTINVKDMRPLTAEDLIRKKDPEAYDRRELANAWKEARPEFNRLKRLARALGITKAVASPKSA